MDAYIDDMVVKSREESDHLRDLSEIFVILQQHKLRLNAAKYTFGVGSGKFLGHLVTRRRIETNPEQIAAIDQLTSPRNAKETQYLPLEKLILVLIVTSCKLMHYFQAHPISVYTEFPLKDVLLKADLSGRLSKWSLELRHFDIKFSPRVAIKGQVLADFMVEFSPRVGVPEQNQSKPSRGEDHNLQDAPSELQPLNGSTEVDLRPPRENGTIKSEDPHEGAEVIIEIPQVDPSLAWRMHVDVAKNSQRAGVGVVLKSLEGAIFEQCLRFNFPAMNNEAEYEALIAGLRSANKLGVLEIYIYSDSKLVVNQVMDKFEARRIKMAKYLRMAKSLISEFRAIKIEQVGRELNAHADVLVALASVFEGEIGRTIAVDVVSVPSIEETQKPVLVNTKLGPSWMDPIMNYLRTDKLPDDKREAHKLRIKATRFWISPSGDLYKRSYQGPYLLCVHSSLVEDVLYEIHKGICGLHSGGRSLAYRALSQGY
ncbi:uncharacterized protein LOC130783528 [Actinidia eriantha]|uniref:uncharacterized protein LOC130783528 n=1 Tax=Actinidia eriantha TaxID=165200 RepID=UPI00258D4674|nr:uncharacterized protein LOC130783528 [Actinidia eriantha]